MTAKTSWAAIAVSAGTVAMALSTQMSIAAPPSARPQATPAGLAELAGRYVSAATGTRFDIDRCGAAWCGVRIKDDASCGDIAMRLTVENATNGVALFEGSFDRRAGENRHAVRGTLFRLDGTVTLRLDGEPGDRLQVMRRTFPYVEAFRRAGDPTCRSQDATS
jgi:hypothetical protein